MNSLTSVTTLLAFFKGVSLDSSLIALIQAIDQSHLNGPYYKEWVKATYGPLIFTNYRRDLHRSYEVCIANVALEQLMLILDVSNAFR
jgi:hypothetical protein